MKFKNYDGKEMSVEEVIQDAYTFIDAGQTEGFEHRILIGSDSQDHRGVSKYVTALAVHRVGKFARYWITSRVIPYSNEIDLSVRLTTEACMTIEVLQAIEDSIIIKMVGKGNISVHIDAGLKGASKKIVSQLEGMMKGIMINGDFIKYETKPYAPVASYLADRYTKKI
jgi:predicted RNase H-related nuclease YkuK (DUF458 family)